MNPKNRIQGSRLTAYSRCSAHKGKSKQYFLDKQKIYLYYNTLSNLDRQLEYHSFLRQSVR